MNSGRAVPGLRVAEVGSTGPNPIGSEIRHVEAAAAVVRYRSQHDPVEAAARLEVAAE